MRNRRAKPPQATFMRPSSHPKATHKPPQGRLKASLEPGPWAGNCLDCWIVPEHECGADDLSQELCCLNVNCTTSMKQITSARAPEPQHRRFRTWDFGLLSGFGPRISDLAAHAISRWHGPGTRMLLAGWLLGAGLVLGISTTADRVRVEKLRCEYLENPL